MVTFAAGCASGDDDVTGDSTTATSQPGSPPAQDDTDDTVEPTSAVNDESASLDCEYLQDAARADGLVGLQIIPQLTSIEQFEAVRSGPLSFDAAALIDYLDRLEPLKDVESPLGDPDADIDFYREVARAVQPLLESPEPPTQEQVDAFMALVGEPGAFIGRQLSISGALGEACGG